MKVLVKNAKAPLESSIKKLLLPLACEKIAIFYKNLFTTEFFYDKLIEE